ncbi:MAG: sugar phosphate isomerase/epimerase [Acidobacteria bacterium]|nr:sugar phosphate isomerase/epimerase [Acidobacteriota bacterium]
MYVALNGTLTANRVEWPEFAKLAATVGFGGTDILGKAIDEGADETNALLKLTRLKPAVVNLPVEFRKDDATFNEGLKKLPGAARFAKAIGCPRVCTWILPSAEQPKPDWTRLLRRRLSACASILAEHGIRFGLENVSPVHLRKRFPHEFIYRTAEMLEFAKSCGPNVGLLLDSWHWHHAGDTVKDILAAGKQNIVHVQAADAPKLPPEEIRDNERLMPGEGIIDFTAFFQALKKIGYVDGVSPEVFGRGLNDIPPHEGATIGLHTTREAMRKAGAL